MKEQKRLSPTEVKNRVSCEGDRSLGHFSRVQEECSVETLERRQRCRERDQRRPFQKGKIPEHVKLTRLHLLDLIREIVFKQLD